MFDVKALLGRHGIAIPDPTCDSRGRPTYRLELTAETILIVCREMELGGCKPSAEMSAWNDSTVVVTERRRGETWVFKHYASNRNQAESMLDDVLTCLERHRQYQGMLDL